jgi:deoxyribose-phosphate aldolase
MNKLKLQQLLKLLDLTRLSDDDSPQAMQEWLQQTATADAVPAAFCVYPQFLQQTKVHLTSQQMSAELATVVNFPSGDAPEAEVVAEIAEALKLGATEIDCVLPYKALLAGNTEQVRQFLIAVRKACGDTSLKIIIESGELVTPQQIIKATELCVQTGADFVKTSTGKVPVGATIESARSILTVLAASERFVGFKASGGVRTVAQAMELVHLYEELTGRIATADGMRIGASALLTELRAMFAA